MASLEAVYHHLVLPPKVPGGQDSDLESIQNDIIRRLLQACHTLHDVTGPELNGTWDYVTKSLETCQKLNQGRLDEDQLTQAFKTLDDRQILILYVVQQNVALVIRRQVSATKDQVIFESFEASPPPSEVLAAEDALQWDFPGRSAQISVPDFRGSDFQGTLPSFLEKASIETIQSLAPHTRKAGVPIIESRATSDPALISQMLISLLEASGSSYDAPKLRKRVRDEVNISDAELPWRRLPFWLILRVAIHRTLKMHLGDDEGRACYKILIATMLTGLLRDSTGKLIPEQTMLLQNKICRRLAKLSNHSEDGSKLLSKLLDAVAPSYIHLGNFESSMSTWATSASLNPQECREKCVSLSEFLKLQQLHDNLARLKNNPGQMSKYVLAVFNVWTQLDQQAIKACPLLRQYRPVFTPELLDALHVSTYAKMRLLRRIQAYLQERLEYTGSSAPSILSEIDRRCFAAQYFETSVGLRERLDEINAESQLAREKKEAEWYTLRNAWKTHTIGDYEGTCMCVRDENGDRDVRGCKKCWHFRKRKQLRIKVHEEFVPQDQAHVAAVMLELNMPQYLQAYRDATWSICHIVASPTNLERSPRSCRTKLADYPPLRSHMRQGRSAITLASDKKSFLDTHYGYGEMRKMLDLTQVLLPHPLNFEYYDQVSQLWVQDPGVNLSLQHICGITLPPSLRPSLESFIAADMRGPLHLSSYDIVANQTQCPPGLSVQEFTAYQQILSSTTLRWAEILREIHSPNLNLGDENTMLMVTQLVMQAGPRARDSPLGTIHSIFLDAAFQQRLTQQTRWKLGVIKNNPREAVCMDLLLTLSLRLFEFGRGSGPANAMYLVQDIRAVTLSWITELQVESQGSTDLSSAQVISRYIFWASMICRRTFSVLVSATRHLTRSELCDYAKASLNLHMNIIEDPGRLASVPKAMLVRDAKISFSLRDKVRNSIMSNSKGLEEAISGVWSQTDLTHNRRFSPWKELSDVYTNEDYCSWIVATSTCQIGGHNLRQTVHYNYVEGCLLIDGKAFGKLPLEIRNSEDVNLLFGDQNLLTSPSPLDGMSHQLLTNPQDHQIHFGLRNGRAVITDLTKDGLLEFIPERVFRGLDSYDLPSNLVDGCIHWLNTATGVLEIRQAATRWFTRENDWKVDIRTRRATRKQSSLVNPHGSLASEIGRIFQGFEEPCRLTIFQPQKQNGRLSVELKHLDLSFFVNQNGLLESRELDLEIDKNQDIQTLHGFASLIVLREVNNHQRRSIITTTGRIEQRRHGMHLVVTAETSNNYYRFTVDSVLGRLSCAPEPRLMLFRALIHAFTSFALPDRLTGRTGTEEALAILASGQCQPWQPLTPKMLEYINSLAKLGPSRRYYPSDKKELQTVSWEPSLPSATQNDCFFKAVSSIVSRSNHLSHFGLNDSGNELTLPDCSEGHLKRRGEVQAARYQRVNDVTKLLGQGKDYVYIPRDRNISSRAVNAYKIANSIWSPQVNVHISRKLGSIVGNWGLIGGFKDVSSDNPITLGSLIETHMSQDWGSHVQFCQSTCPTEQFRLAFRLCLLAFSAKSDMDMVQALAAIALTKELKELPTPLGTSFDVSQDNEFPNKDALARLVSTAYPEFEENYKLPIWEQARRRKEYSTCKERTCRRIARHIAEQWPAKYPSFDGFLAESIDLESVLEMVKPEWERAHQNLGLLSYLDKVQVHLDKLERGDEHLKPSEWNNGAPIQSRKRARLPVPSLTELLAKDGPVIGPIADVCTARSEGAPTGPTAQVQELERIVERFIGNAIDHVRKQYGRDLARSLEAYKTKPNESHQPVVPESTDSISIFNDIQYYSGRIERLLNSIRRACSADDQRFRWLGPSTLWPCSTPVTILEQLRSTAVDKPSPRMKDAIVAYGVSLTVLQKHHRMLDAIIRRQNQKLMEEYHNIGHQNWDPLEVPDWLLLEIDADILIRQEQVDVARAIVAKGSSTNNSVMQLNMGRGKTSVIVPMAVCLLADKKQLARLIVPHALLLQTAQTLQSRIGLLIGRKIVHIPFSRRTPTSQQNLTLYEKLHKRLMASQGVMITTPETVLSFKLSGLQHLRDRKLPEASAMIGFQTWMTRFCRDVLDESDFTLAVKTQLIYPSGGQEALDGHPHRWLIAQNILALVAQRLLDVQRSHPKGITVTKRHQSYPVAYFLNIQTEAYLSDLLILDIADGRLGVVKLLSPVSPKAHLGIKDVLSIADVDPGRIRDVSQYFTDPEVAFKCLYLLRGLIKGKVLVSCLKKRWNVQYGLHESRDPIAVPFEAKGVPHPQAEFGHPDAAIILTCLSYYYAGVNLRQMMQGLQVVLNSDDPVAEFDRWTGGCQNVPETLQDVNCISLEDKRQMNLLWRCVRLSKSVLDHFMNNFVFPVHAKQFTIKLQTSGWDLPHFSPADGDDVNITTGFSGTNDNKWMLPLTISQRDLPTLHHTNAEVLTYLLQNRNREYIAAIETKTKEAWSEKRLLENIHGKGIRLLIDAGAYILDMNNETVAQQWLQIDKQAKAAVYFRTDNRAWVKYRGNRKSDAPLLATPFADNMDDCVVYLDQAHTRGTDMKFAPLARGALTLALGQSTKDHTVQAAMRLRQLKTTQSIMFVAPPEVHLSILDVCKKDRRGHVNSADVVYWLIEQTCSTNEQLQGLYFAQGKDFCRRMNAAHNNKGFLKSSGQRVAYLKFLEQPEHQTLQQMYGTGPHVNPQSKANPGVATIEVSSKKLKSIGVTLMKKRHASHTGVDLHVLGEVEQEREVEFQVEEVREVQKPGRHEALSFPGLHKELEEFVRLGALRFGHPFRHVFDVAGNTEVGEKHAISKSPTRLFVSKEFERTIKFKKGQRNDSFMRSVEWILWSRLSETGIFIIREEAEKLVDLLRGQAHPKVYLVTYAAPVTKAMEMLGKMTFYTIPSLPAGYKFPTWLPLEVGIFAGRLYLDFESWSTIDMQLREDSTKDDGKHKAGQLVAKSPRGFLLDWLSFRRRGQDVLHTPMGYLCQGRQLTKDHAFFSEATATESSPWSSSIDSEDFASDVDDSEESDHASSEEAFDDK
ncbi:hypothetical protein PG996_008497 [Apiospora saccharicola]|uniref:ubiquitinyl hydrolase 1 n=1 Tax=Apiospora saccharicola TaxID=335842 RepID=A0ABR1V0M2_9PEZI